MERAEIDYYTRAARMTSAGAHSNLMQGLPRDVGALAKLVPGLLLHEHWAPAYGQTLSDERHGEAHIRSLDAMLERLLAHDARPLTQARPLETRLVAVCRHFSLLLVAMLRAQGVPARARCGFGAYFITGQFEDHWACEYWKPSERRWVLVDPQMDELQTRQLKLDFDPLDVPRDRFIVAGDAWASCRSGETTPAQYGIFTMRGLWFIAGNVVRDVAALANMEMLPWDVWGGMLQPDAEPRPEELEFLDRLAPLSRAPDEHFDEIRRIAENDDRVRVPATVFNAVRQRAETV